VNRLASQSSISSKDGPLLAMEGGPGWAVSLLSTMDVPVGAANPTVGRKDPARWLEPLPAPLALKQVRRSTDGSVSEHR
jgi:hypothetical protein